MEHSFLSLSSRPSGRSLRKQAAVGWDDNNLGNPYQLIAIPGPGAPIPKFASHCCTLVCELRNQRCTSNVLILVRLLNLKFLNELAAI